MHIDGALGEGGGQVLRSSLALSLLTGKPFTMDHIRARRKKPGLLKQHLTAVRAAKEVGAAEVRGDAPGSPSLHFVPGAVQAGNYRFDIGSAGSCLLVLQTILPALMVADRPSRLVLHGGTHNPFAPPYDFFEKTFLAIVRRMGPNVECALHRWGFYPAGGGHIEARITPCKRLEPVEIVQRGPILGRRLTAVITHLPRHIAERETGTFTGTLQWHPDEATILDIANAAGPGNVLMAELRSQALPEIFSAFGRRGLRAEEVARQLADQVRDYLDRNAPVGPYLADQLLIPLAMAGAGRFRTGPLTSHTRTNMAVIQRFLDVSITSEECGDGIIEVKIGR